MTALQKKHRIKLLWKKARKILLYSKLRMASKQYINKSPKAVFDDDNLDILENFNNER